MVRLADERDAIALEPLDDPHLPQGPGAIERLRHDPADQALEHTVVTRPRERRVADMVGEAEAIVVDPDGEAFPRHVRDTLAEARHEVQPRVNRAPDAVDVDPAVGEPERCGVEQHHRPDVHVGRLVLDAEEGGVHRAQALVVGHQTSFRRRG